METQSSRVVFLLRKRSFEVQLRRGSKEKEERTSSIHKVVVKWG